MKLLKFAYRMRITMDATVTAHHFTLRCVPMPDECRQVLALHTEITPADWLRDGTDEWGNGLILGACRAEHTAFSIEMSGTMRTGLADSVRERDSKRARVYRYSTPLTRASTEMLAFADRIDPIEAPIPIRAETIMRAVGDWMRYCPGTTDVHTVAAQAFETRRGVCQDYTHIMLSLLRAHRIPARYTVGMFCGEGKSHAWVEVLDGDHWRGYDPTNGRMADDRYIKLSHGRDYTDCMINRGVFRGIARQTTEVSVIVREEKGSE